MNLIVNGEPSSVADATTVFDLVTALAGDQAHGVAVAVNDQVVPRSSWRETALADGDAVEILTAVQGG